MKTGFKISWVDSAGQPSFIHLVAVAGGADTACKGHDLYIRERVLQRSPQKKSGRSNFCKVCFRGGGKANPWDPRCAPARCWDRWERQPSTEAGKPLKSGDRIPSLAGTMVTLPYANQHPCFGQRQGFCQNLATWRMESTHLMLHFCDDCKRRPEFKGDEYQWTKLEVRNDTN